MSDSATVARPVARLAPLPLLASRQTRDYRLVWFGESGLPRRMT